MKRINWKDQDIAVLLSTYVYMRRIESTGVRVNKAQLRRDALAQLQDVRSAGSYEMKMCNISAAMIACGQPIVNGYKPLGHAQKSLELMIRSSAS